MLVSTGEAAKKYPGAIHLSETARFIWERVDTMSREEIAEAMLTEFEIDLPTAQRDVTVFLYRPVYKKRIDRGMILHGRWAGSSWELPHLPFSYQERPGVPASLYRYKTQSP